MIRFVVVRLTRAVVVVFGLVVVTFFLSRAVSDPVNIMLPLTASEADRQRVREQLGLTKPLMEQFFSYIGGLLHGDFGNSIWQSGAALPIVLHHLQPSVLLASTAIFLAMLIGLPLGFLGGVRPGSWMDRLSSVASAGSVAIPDFWLGIMLILLFSVEWRLLPTSGYGGIKHLILPAVTLSLRPAGRLARVTREAVLEEMSKRYVLAARARGLTMRQVLTRHVLKNTAIAVTTVLGYDFLFVFTGYAAVVEIVFDWPGVGRLAVEATLNQDVVLVSAIVVVSGLLIAVVNMLMDIGHAAIDRRAAG